MSIFSRSGVLAAAAAALLMHPCARAGDDGAQLVRTYCSGCHQPVDGQLNRIGAMRKTPEGWVMTLARMRQVHGLNLSDEVRDGIVHYLSDTQGLAPSESAAGRFALERRPNAQDLDLGPEIGVMCGRCHSLARAALQRRDEAEWRKLAHTHVGQWPSLEYQASGRDRPWWQIASGPMPSQLAALFPLKSAAWDAWRAHRKADLAGGWTVVSHVPGGRDFYGTARIERSGTDGYTVSYQFTDVDGSAFAGSSRATVYTGYEWRGNAEVNERSRREVFAVSEDGNRITGRWFDADHAEEGGEWTAVRDGGPAQILALWPQSLRAGSSAELVVVASAAVRDELTAGDGLTVSGVQREGPIVRAHIAAAASAAPGQRRLSLGGMSAPLAVYNRIDVLDVQPKYGIARLGGGRIDPVSAQFEAIGAARLPDGGMMSLGPLPVSWSTEPFNAEAKRTEDDKYAGYIDRRGRFLPSVAGPNPAREFSGNNTGDLAVVAQAADGSAVSGRSHLIVTVQRWITPPIY